jgi:uncharacterized protein
MRLKIVENVGEFAPLASKWLQESEGVNAVALGVMKNMLSDNPRYDKAYWGVIFDGERVVGTGIMTPPYPLNINAVSIEAVPHFVDMAKQIERPSSVLGPGQFAKKFSDTWCETSAAEVSNSEAQAIHRLDEVCHQEATGELITASSHHQELLDKWGIGFCNDCGMEEDIPTVTDHNSRAIAEGSRYLLLVDGEPVSMAGKARETENGGTINWVYTPPEFRKKGYASEIVAKLSQKILDSGKKHVFLYTQLDNPTSNKIYREVGFRVISDSWHIRFKYSDDNGSAYD